MSKFEKREEIINENNSAQSILETIVDDTDFSQTRELHITNVLHGDLDFSILKEKKITNVIGIFFDNPGEVTSLLNIPESVKILDCSDQVLIDIKNIPLEIEKINLSKNIIQNFDGNNLSKLTDLDLSYNELTSVKNLPESLQHLNVENNKLKEMNLAETPNLKTLICSNNPILTLQHVPSSLSKIVMENNPFIEIEYEDHSGKKESTKKLDYLESINKYFKIKNDYEIKVRTLKRNAYKKGSNKKEARVYVNDVKIPCINCKRNVGTQFYNKDQHYNAKCGDSSKPCDLDIQIFCGDYFRMDTLMNAYKYDIENDKEDIIVSKMDSLFKYINDNTSTKNFEKNIKDYNESTQLYDEVETRYNDVYNNEEKKESLRKQIELFYNVKENLKLLLDEYKKTGNRKVLITMVESYKKDLIPVVDKIRTLKYAHMYVDIDNNTNMSILKQYFYPAHSKDFTYGEEPTVVKFIMN